MELFIKIVQFIASLSLLVLIHEFGHFITAKIFGVRVEKFYIFFNPWFSLVKFRIGETEFGIGWVPFGGYCKISGMIDESMDVEQMKQPPQPYEFRSKPAWQRLLIMTGGVIMNVILAIVVYIGMSYKWGDQYIANDDIKYGYVFNALGHEAGFRDGDKILSVGGEKIEEYRRVFVTIAIKNAPVEVLRDGQVVTVDIPQEMVAQMLDENNRDFMQPRIPFVVGEPVKDGSADKAGILPNDSLVAFNGESMEFYDQYQKAFAQNKGLSVELTVARDSAGATVFRTMPVVLSDDGKMGVNVFTGLSRFFPVQTHKYTFLQSISVGVKRTGQEISNYWDQLKLIVKPKTGAYKSLGGFMSIGKLFGSTWDWVRFWDMTALLSIVLAIMNILPIPALDGGHVLFLLWEVVTGRKPGDKFMEYAQITGLLLVFALLLFANANDIYRFFIK